MEEEEVVEMEAVKGAGTLVEGAIVVVSVAAENGEGVSVGGRRLAI